jgi:2-(1,2-epoxy-1,2-dihydrophenyl)acetyl-CoA isomerase
MRPELTTTTIEIRVHDAIASVTVNRPGDHNAVTTEMVQLLHLSLGELRERADVHVVALTGAGRVFRSGADLAAATSPDAFDSPPTAEEMDVSALLHDMPQVTIVLINGACAGASFGWASACDLRIALRRARFNTAFLSLGLAGDMGAAWTLLLLVGSGRARDFFFTRLFEAEEAAACGLVGQLYDDDEFEERSVEVLQELGRGGWHHRLHLDVCRRPHGRRSRARVAVGRNVVERRVGE